MGLLADLELETAPRLKQDPAEGVIQACHRDTQGDSARHPITSSAEQARLRRSRHGNLNEDEGVQRTKPACALAFMAALAVVTLQSPA
mmetsp:Transcript_56781/g.135258  ORF Transcript_56781/g.135258 Transcript_56781/m.135258 type:complete len:88 (+) Transcript_56781:119-382(+)